MTTRSRRAFALPSSCRRSTRLIVIHVLFYLFLNSPKFDTPRCRRHLVLAFSRAGAGRGGCGWRHPSQLKLPLPGVLFWRKVCVFVFLGVLRRLNLDSLSWVFIPSDACREEWGWHFSWKMLLVLTCLVGRPASKELAHRDGRVWEKEIAKRRLC